MNDTLKYDLLAAANIYGAIKVDELVGILRDYHDDFEVTEELVRKTCGDEDLCDLVWCSDDWFCHSALIGFLCDDDQDLDDMEDNMLLNSDNDESWFDYTLLNSMIVQQTNKPLKKFTYDEFVKYSYDDYITNLREYDELTRLVDPYVQNREDYESHFAILVPIIFNCEDEGLEYYRDRILETYDIDFPKERYAELDSLFRKIFNRIPLWKDRGYTQNEH